MMGRVGVAPLGEHRLHALFVGDPPHSPWGHCAALTFRLTGWE